MERTLVFTISEDYNGITIQDFLKKQGFSPIDWDLTK